MPANTNELQFLSTWAREEKAVNPYALPAHNLQAAHKVSGVALIRAIKGWARGEGRKDEEIFDLYKNHELHCPWSSQEEMSDRLAAIAVRAEVGVQDKVMQAVSKI